jgi:hypothetical protein
MGMILGNKQIGHLIDQYYEYDKMTGARRRYERSQSNGQDKNNNGEGDQAVTGLYTYRVPTPLPLSLHVAKAGRNHLNEEITHSSSLG